MTHDDVTVCICTHGAEHWRQLAADRAVPTALQQGCHVLHEHQPAGTLASTRNAALEDVATPWVLFLDADDELEAGCVDQLRVRADRGGELFAPAVRYVRSTDRPGLRHERAARMPRVAGHTHACTTTCLMDGNWIVVGALAPTTLLRAVGGWREWPCYEDWDLWLRCVAWRGARAVAVPSAVYRAHVRPDSRNRGSVTRAVKEHTHAQIVDSVAHGPIPLAR